MRGLKFESFAKFSFEWKTFIYVWVYVFATYELSWSTEKDYSS